MAVQYIYVVWATGNVVQHELSKIDCRDIPHYVSQGNAFYDRDSAELAVRKRAAQVKWERLSTKYPVVDALDMMGEDEELLC